MTNSKFPVAASNAARLRSRRLAEAYFVAADAPATVRAYTADWESMRTRGVSVSRLG